MKQKISRRNFMKTGSYSLAGMMAMPTFMQALSSCSTNSEKINEFVKYFGITEDVLKKTMTKALSKGGDYCDLFFEHTISNNISLRDNSVNSARSNIDYGVGVRVLKGDQTGYAYSEEINLEAMLKVAETAGNIANQNKAHSLHGFNICEHPDYYAVQTSWEKVSIDQKIPFLEKLNEKIMALDSRVEKVSVRYGDNSSVILFADSEGKLATDIRPLGRLTATCVMQENGKREQAHCSRSFRQGFEFLSDELIDELAKETIEQTAIKFKAGKPKGGEMPVVLGAGSSGILLHEAIGHTFEADFNRKKESIFCDKMGKKVAEDFVTIVDDGTVPNSRGALNIDDEGNLTEKTFLVKDGILTSYIHDRLSAQHYGVKPTGNGRRQSFRFPPLPRMRNTYMLAGPHSEEEIIASVKNGVYVDGFTNGEVNIGAGDFTFYVSNGYIIENGKLTEPIKDINLIGNGPQALKDITMVADNLQIDTATWTCGKGQSVPVSLGMPTVKVAKLTVGGKS